MGYFADLSSSDEPVTAFATPLTADPATLAVVLTTVPATDAVVDIAVPATDNTVQPLTNTARPARNIVFMGVRLY